MNLIIVESPTKARTLGRFLGKDYQVDSTMGHLVDLPKSQLGVDVEHDFKPEWVEVAKRADAIKTLQSDAKKASKIYLATDPDREGEAIAWHVAGLLKLEVGSGKDRTSHISRLTSISRIVFHEITESAVKHALENPGTVNLQLVDAQQARRVLDRLVGYKLSPLLWKKVRTGLSAGRVQSVAVKLIVEREREIEAFRPVEFWEIYVEVSKVGKVPKVPKASDTFSVKLVAIEGKKTEVSDGTRAREIVGDLEKALYTVLSVEKKEIKKRPYPPFTTSTMTQSAARTFFWSAKRTMSVAQKLYEEGLITYHRTDSLNLAEQAISAARDFIVQKFGDKFLSETPRRYKTSSRVAQEAHEAVRPTDSRVTSNEEEVISLGADAAKLYALIWKRFVACQMAEAILDQTTIKVNALRQTQGKQVNYLLQTGGQTTKFDGWRKVYGDKFTDGEQDLPNVDEGEKLRLIKVDPQQKFTQPPPRYNEASLIKTLEKLGIGRPSTYAPTISTIQARQYVEKIEGAFKPSSVGIAVNDFLVANFPDVFDYQFTARMEGDLDEIANGSKEWVPVIRDFWSPFSKKLESVTENSKRVKIEVEKTGEKCPDCKEGEQVIRVGRFGKFLSCARFPDCDWSANYAEKINMKCPDCREGDVIIKKTRKGRQFYGCSRYPECKFASWKKPQLVVSKES
ncbi:MAG: type I DNA topoisomerase [bacterium]|nr:type I DNA topoisomerase [bacterium]